MEKRMQVVSAYSVDSGPQVKTRSSKVEQHSSSRTVIHNGVQQSYSSASSERSALNGGHGYSSMNGSAYVGGYTTKFSSDYVLENERILFEKLNARLKKYIENVHCLQMSEADVKTDVQKSNNTVVTVSTTEIESYYQGIVHELDIELKRLLNEKARLLKERKEQEARYYLLEEKIRTERQQNIKIVTEKSREHELEITRVINTTQHESDARLVAQLDALRREYEGYLQQARADITKWCKVDLDIDVTTSGLNGLIVAKTDALDYGLRITTLQSEIQTLEVKVSELQAIDKSLAVTIDELSRLSDLTKVADGYWEKKFIELKHQFDTELAMKISEKVRLGAELEYYYKLLSEEEARLHQFHATQGKGTGRTFKYRGHSYADIVIDDICIDGNYIQLRNKGFEDFHLATWALRAKAGGVVRIFKFQADPVLRAGKAMKIWSPDCGGVHSPPDSIVMKNITWPTGEEILAELLDSHENVVAYLDAGY